MGLDSDCTDYGSDFPPGFRFHPTDEELVGYYLKRKVCRKRHHRDVIGETDVYKCDPEELPAMSKLRTGDRQWFFFSPRDRKYPNGARSNRATSHGYWKATGKDRIISCGSRAAGSKKTLVFYRGRAPRGERTDWVMHEYTMDYEELKRCAGAKEYYALYKVFKKSGPGPKNGEQYGAPFREEDWDKEDLEVQPFFFGENPVTKSAYDTVPINESMPENEPIETLRHPKFDDGNTLGQPVAEQGTESKHSASDVPAPVPHTFIPRIDVLDSNFGQAGMTGVHLHEAAEVSSAPVHNDLDTGLTEEEIFGDFLEMDDLLGPCPATQNHGQPYGELLLDELDGLNEFDFQDTSSFLFDGGISQSAQMPETFSGCFGYDISTMSTLSTSTHHFQQQPANVSEFVCTEGQSFGIQGAESGQENVPSSNPGFPNQTLDRVNRRRATGADENRINRPYDDGNDSRFSSVIWSYMESIPTTPASASESPFANRALGRMSSFRRLRLSTRDKDDVSGNNVSPGNHRTNCLMFLVSLVGVFCAVVWMLVRTSVRLVSR